MLWALASAPLVVLVAFAVLVASWAAGIRLPVVSGATWMRVEKTASGRYTPAWNQPVFFLVIGSDYRAGVGGSRADSVHLVGVNPTTHAATILGFPRDTSVAIPGHGRDKINAANAYGGPKLVAEVVGGLFGVDIPYTVITDFDGFINLIDEMGGLTVDVPYPMHDPYSGSDFDPGPQHLSGERVLAFSRDRHTFATGDIKRSENQGIVFVSALAQLRKENTTAPSQLRALAVAARHTQIDGIGLHELYDLLQLGMQVDPAQVRNVVIPVGSGSGSNLAVGGGAADLFADFRDDATLQSH